MTYNDVQHLAAKIKPKQQRVHLFSPFVYGHPVLENLSDKIVLLIMQVELEIGVNTLSPNYCRSKGEQIALNVDGTGYDEGNTYSTYVCWLSVSQSVVTEPPV